LAKLILTAFRNWI